MLYQDQNAYKQDNKMPDPSSPSPVLGDLPSHHGHSFEPKRSMGPKQTHTIISNEATKKDW